MKVNGRSIVLEVDEVGGSGRSWGDGGNVAEQHQRAAPVDQDARLPPLWEVGSTEALVLPKTNQQLGEILGVASHELKTPLTIVKVSLQLTLRQLSRCLRAEPAAPADVIQALHGTWELLQVTERQVDRLSLFLDDLLDLSRMEAGMIQSHFERCDLGAIVSEAVAAQRLIWPDRRIVFDPPADVTAPIVADARRIGQVVTNYLSNALKYSPEDGPVDVWLEVGETEARVCVRDEGPGLPAAEQQRIWERFQRGEGVEPRSGTDGGLGLGLYISRTIVEHHQGEVGLESAPGQGATFWCTLPLACGSEEVG
jgi:signal transduction histidine kinase